MCKTCKTADHVANATTGVCAAAVVDDKTTAATGKAKAGKPCNSTGTDTGCDTDLQCGKVAAKTTGTRRLADEVAVVLETCMDADGCKVTGVTCGAVNMGASLVAAVAMAYYM